MQQPDKPKTTYSLLVRKGETKTPPRIIFSTTSLKWIKALVEVHSLEVGWYAIVDELEELNESDDTVPDPTPFDPSRAQTDPRIYVCNQVLEKSIKTYTLYLRLATRAKSPVISQLFEYLAQLEKRQIDELRDICKCY